MIWWKSWLLTILQKVFPSEKPDYQDLQAWAREKEVHPIYAIELTCYKHDRPIALEQRSIGVWHCPICSKPKPSVWIDEIAKKQVQMQISTEKPNPFKDMPPGTLARAHHRMVQHKIHLSGAVPREDRFLLDDNPTREVPSWRDDQAV